MEDKYKNSLIAISIMCFILGRVCDDMNWYSYPAISSNNLEAISISGLIVSAFLIILARFFQKDGLKAVFI